MLTGYTLAEIAEAYKKVIRQMKTHVYMSVGDLQDRILMFVPILNRINNDIPRGTIQAVIQEVFDRQHMEQFFYELDCIARRPHDYSE